MKKQISMMFIAMPLIFSGCNTWGESSSEEENYLPIPIEDYGKEVAKELHKTVKNLSKMEVDYSDANSSEEFKERFYADYSEASSVGGGIDAVQPMKMSAKTFSEKN